jgi:hypothetical protein
METCIWLPEAPEYEMQISDNVITSRLDSAASIAAVLYLYNSIPVNATWKLDLIDYWEFCEFYNDRIKNVEPFYIDLITSKRRPQQVVAWFQDHTFSLQAIQGRLYTASATLEVVKNG